MCRDLSEIARYARVDNTQFRLLKSATPGAYTFVLDASKELPKRIAHERRKTLEAERRQVSWSLLFCLVPAAVLVGA